MICMKNLRFSSRPRAKFRHHRGHRALLEHSPVLYDKFFTLVRVIAHGIAVRTD